MSSSPNKQSGQSPNRKQLIPPDVAAQIPALLSTAEESDPVAHVKLFQSGTGWTWYVAEYDGQNNCYGLVAGIEVEAGDFTISELEGLYKNLDAYGSVGHMLGKGVIIGPVERDTHFTPTRFSELRTLHGSRRFTPGGPTL
jgi:hypothetical protein